MESPVKKALDYSTGRHAGNIRKRRPGKRNPFGIMRWAFAAFFAYAAILYVFRMDRAKGDAIRIAVIVMLGVGVSYLIERTVSGQGSSIDD